jgi:hypothetical protein
MESDAVAGTEVEADGRVMAAIEDGPVAKFVLADVTRDGAYVTLPLSEAASLPAWR